MIYKVIEAFSMQPIHYVVGNMVNGMRIKKIEVQSLKLKINDEHKWTEYYVGRDEDGRVIFEIPCTCASVQYKYIDT